MPYFRSSVTDCSIGMIALHCRRLERLSIDECSRVSSWAVDLVKQRCVGLKHLEGDDTAPLPDHMVTEEPESIQDVLCML